MPLDGLGRCGQEEGQGTWLAPRGVRTFAPPGLLPPPGYG